MKKGWQTKQLGELAELRGRIGWRGLTAKEYTKSGPLFLSVHSLNYGDYVDFRDAFHISEERYIESPEIVLKKDDVLICKDGAGIGKLGIVGELPDSTTINSSLLLIRSRKDILPKFLYRCLTSPYFQDIVQSRLNGATTPHLYQRDITEFPIVLPPLPEQQRIVGLLDEAFDGIATAKANAEKNLQNARALFESHLQSVFTQRGKGWVESRLDDVCDLITCGVAKRPDYVASGVPFLSAKNVKNGQIVWSGFQSVSEETHQALTKNNKPKLGDVLYTRVGSYGEAAIVDREDDFSVFVSLTLIKTKPTLLNTFLKYYLNSSSIKQLASKSISGSGVGNLNVGTVRQFPIQLPSISEQRNICGKLGALQEEIQRLESIYQQKLAALAALKKSLLHQAFTGDRKSVV